MTMGRANAARSAAFLLLLCVPPALAADDAGERALQDAEKRIERAKGERERAAKEQEKALKEREKNASAGEKDEIKKALEGLRAASLGDREMFGNLKEECRRLQDEVRQGVSGSRERAARLLALVEQAAGGGEPAAGEPKDVSSSVASAGEPGSRAFAPGNVSSGASPAPPPAPVRGPPLAEPPSPSAVGGGFGGAAPGGAGKPVVRVRAVADLKSAFEKGNVSIEIEARDLDVPEKIETKADNITLDGKGATLRGDRIPREMQMLKFVGGSNFVVRNLRLRNAGDNLAFYAGARKILVERVSSTGAGDDGLSLSGASDATAAFCFLAGNTRTVFIMKGGGGTPDNHTIHHCILMKSWQRNPKLDGVAHFDVRNNLIREWKASGVRLSNSSGNIMGNVFDSGPKGSKTKAIQDEGGWGRVHIADNEFRGCRADRGGTADKPEPAPAILPPYTTDLRELEKTLFSETVGAGCMPRDAVDKAYLASDELPPAENTPLRIPKTGEPLPGIAPEK